ncbi:MAG: 50S ribosomal protein L25/general stress protein Ctc [Alphaproteobacteria bacterium]|nr:50S ribosomal protein L25/general stress protein Ctc [Alphaproteobacteria bacterium]|tara:strand:- start:8892 stop:9614 length:723 start_codon:yes stop_codon:yes gene_type:complete
MSDADVMTAQGREERGRGAARAARRSGRVPGVIYGAGKDTQSISVDRRELDREMGRGGFYTRLYSLKVDEKAEQVLPREVQVHPVTDVPMHVDFLRLSGDSTIRLQIPVYFENEEESPGVKRGGVVNIVRHEVEVNCRADAIPENFTADLTGLEIGDAVRISDISMPEGVELVISDRDFTIATITASSAAIEEAAEEAAAAEAALLAAGEGEEGEMLEGVGGEAAEAPADDATTEDSEEG